MRRGLPKGSSGYLSFRGFGFKFSGFGFEVSGLRVLKATLGGFVIRFIRSLLQVPGRTESIGWVAELKVPGFWCSTLLPIPRLEMRCLQAWKVVGGPMLCMCIYTPRERERERERERDRAYVQKLECVLFECVRTGEKVPEHPPGAPSALPKGPWEVRQQPQHIGPKAQLPGSFGSFSRSFPFTSKSCVFWRYIVVEYNPKE